VTPPLARIAQRRVSSADMPLANVFVDLLLKMRAKLFFYFFIRLIGMEKETETQGQGVEPLFDIQVQASLSWTIPEMAAETRFQLAVSCSSCFRPSGVRE
jgi:hypothetical protein